MSGSFEQGRFYNYSSGHTAWTIALWILVAVLTSTGSLSKEMLKIKPKIIGGSKLANMKAFEVSLFNSKHPHFCGGAIIRPNWILTSAHCRGVCDIEGFCAVRYATLQLKTGQIAPIRLFLCHEEYTKEPFLRNDIALVEAPLDNSFDYVYIPIYPYEVPYNEDLTLVGWGWTDSDVGSCSKHLRYAELQRANCPKGLSLSFFCAQSNDSSPCHGDSGGSLLYQGELIGLVGFALKNSEKTNITMNGEVSKPPISKKPRCKIGEFVAFTYIAKFLPWITSTIQQVYAENDQALSDFQGWTEKEEELLRIVAGRRKLC